MYRLPDSISDLYAALALLFATPGCQTGHEEKKKDKGSHPCSSLHQEVNRDGAEDNEPVPIFRENPVYVNVSKSAFVDISADLAEASGVVDDLGGFFPSGSSSIGGARYCCKSVTTANRGRRIAVFATFGQKRWLASPVISKPISNGIFTFTPDATREEADRIVKGLNNVSAKIKKEDK